MEIVMIGVEILRRALCRMPGGTLLALLIYLYRQPRLKHWIRSLSISRVADRL